MIVCICRVVCERKIRAAIDEGASSVDEVGELCRAGTACGSCRPMISQMLEQAGVSSSATSSGCPGRAFEISSPYLGTPGEAT